MHTYAHTHTHTQTFTKRKKKEKERKKYKDFDCRYLDTSLMECDVQPTYARVILKGKVITFLLFMCVV